MHIGETTIRFGISMERIFNGAKSGLVIGCSIGRQMPLNLQMFVFRRKAACAADIHVDRPTLSPYANHRLFV
jgi:hypothetical protein